MNQNSFVSRPQRRLLYFGQELVSGLNNLFSKFLLFSEFYEIQNYILDLNLSVRTFIISKLLQVLLVLESRKLLIQKGRIQKVTYLGRANLERSNIESYLNRKVESTKLLIQKGRIQKATYLERPNLGRYLSRKFESRKLCIQRGQIYKATYPSIHKGLTQ